MLGGVRPLAMTLAVVSGGILVLLVLLWVGQRSLIYLPGGAVPSTDAVLPGATEVVLRTDDGLELGAWHLAAPDGAHTVLVAPGNAGNRAARAPLAQGLRERGLGVLLLDYRGYGGNPGRPTEDGLARDVRAARRHLVEEAGVADRDLVYYGESIGAAVAVELAVEHPPAGLLLRSPFTSLADAAAVHYPILPVGLLLRDRFEVVEHVAEVDVPTVVVLGTADRIIPPEQSRRVAEAAAGPVRVVEVEGADHNDLVLLGGDELLDAVAALSEAAR
jgi:uncharacterized protein